MSRDLEEYALYTIKQGLEDRKGQSYDTVYDLMDEISFGIDDTQPFIYGYKSVNFASHCWDDIQDYAERDPDMLPANAFIVINPEAYGIIAAHEAIREVFGRSETLDAGGEIELTDEVIRKLIEEMGLDQYRVIDGMDPEDRMVKDYEVDKELSFAGQSFEEYIDGYISDELDGQLVQSGITEVYGCDLASRLTECDNVNGSVFCSTYKAEEFIKRFWNEAEDTLDYLSHDLGLSHEEIIDRFDPLYHAEAFQFCMVDKAVQERLGNSDFLQKHWNEQIALDDMAVAYIKADLGIRASFGKDAVITIPEDEKFENHYFLTNGGCVLEWRHDDFAEEPDEADFELDDDSQAKLCRRQEAYENDEVFIPTVFSKDGKPEDMDITNYGREVNPGSHEIIEYLGQYSDIEQCLSVNMDKIQAQEKEDKQVKTKVRSM